MHTGAGNTLAQATEVPMTEVAPSIPFVRSFHNAPVDGRAPAVDHCVLWNRTCQWETPRAFSSPAPGILVMRLRRGAPLVPASIYQLCPMVIPQPIAVSGPNPEDWCRPLDRSPRLGALIHGKPPRSTGCGHRDPCGRLAPRNTRSAWAPCAAGRGPIPGCQNPSPRRR
jgi:hypothetical protein